MNDRQDSASQSPPMFVPDDAQRQDMARRSQAVDDANQAWLERVAEEQTPRGAIARTMLEEIRHEKEEEVL